MNYNIKVYDKDDVFKQVINLQ